MQKNILHISIIKASAVLMVWIISFGILDNYLNSDLVTYPKIINISGKQRMLSQKAAYIAVSELPSKVQQKEFLAVKNELLNNHNFLAENLKTQTLKSFYSSHKIGEQLNKYLSLLQAYSPLIEDNQNNTHASIIELEEIYRQSQDLLNVLDQAVSEFEKASDNSTANLLIFRFIMALLTLFVMALLYYTFLAKALRHNAQDVLLKDKAILRFKKLFDYSYEGLIILDKNWRIEHTNQAARNIFLGSDKKATIDNFWQNTLSENLKVDIVSKINEDGRWEGELNSPLQQNNYFFLSIFEIKGEQQTSFYGATVRDITELKQKESELHNLALFDGLTGLANRPNVIEHIRLACEQPTSEVFAILFLDVDEFKQINDGYGHEVGDRLLTEVANRLKQTVKQSDVVARLGGDEFIILAKNVKDKDCLVTVSQRIIKAFERPLPFSNLKLKVSLSIGISLYPDDALNPTDLLKKADLAMYSAKQKGKNQFYFFNTTMETYLKERFSFEEDLKYGLQHNEFYQVFQPLLEVNTNKVVGCEVLLRWESARRGHVSPNSFIPMCESLNLMPLIDKMVFDKSIDILKKLPQHLYYSINISAVHLSNTAMLENFIKRLSYFESKKRIVFELTETSIIKDLTRTIRILSLIRDNGFSVAIDDFGTGYTSLHNLKLMDFDIIKIDRAFIKDITSDSQSKSIVKAITTLAQEMNMKVIAEGVEDIETNQYLKGIDCDYVQGFYYSKPLSYKDFIAFADNHNPS
ncbi:bifunctional diguanylate cyclase/phosphodiesterase [Paraglaciecola marina]|uniref:bifunctional diguanylate cyclase/phosphodiesterase n=1 Tax=Paraglaciecola marina TaxID=2500157 RepID=UPI001060F1D7|nr:bifunctional diguanylate cyclase/phosphodiesterase [Paraglaciecola marina]